MAGRRRYVRWVLTATVIVLGAYVGYLALGDRSLDLGFRSVAEGASRQQVVSILGPPDEVRAGCRDLPTWMNRPTVAAACAEELEYRAKLKSTFWTIGFDGQGRAIAKYRYVAR
jgi:hypothetical protein